MERKSYSAIDSIFAGDLNVSWGTIPIVVAYIPIMPPMGQLHGSRLIIVRVVCEHHVNINIVFTTVKLDSSTCWLKKQHFVELENCFFCDIISSTWLC
jgi:hypothetical protein